MPAFSVLDKTAPGEATTWLDRCVSASWGLPVQPATSIVPDRSTALVGGAREHRVVVSPGAIRITYGQARGFERARRDPADVARLSAELTRLQDKVWEIHVCEGWWESYDTVDRFLTRIHAIRLELGLVSGRPGRGRCGEWSRKSRARMTRRLATLDYTPWSTLPSGLAVALVTLTYPGPDQALAPTGEVAKAHLKAFRTAVERKYGEAPAIWKLERQRRGAPHFHIAMPCFEMTHREHRAQRDWMRATWARIIRVADLQGPALNGLPFGVDELGKMLRSGSVSIDFREGSRLTDPQRIATYFSKHNSPGLDSSKAYQNEAPDGWLDPADGGGVGRFWGYWRLKPIEVETIVTADDAVALTRLLRSYVRAQRRTRSVVRHRVDRRTGVIRNRRTTERYRVRALGGCKPAGFVIVNDAPSLVEQFSRALMDPADWLPGERRPLP